MERIEKKKVLILTLGVGDFFSAVRGESKDKNGNDVKINYDDDLEMHGWINEIIENRKYPYTKVNYFMVDEDYDHLNPSFWESEYVAFPISQIFRPDVIFVVGTVKTDWASFYIKLCSKRDDGLGINDEDIRNAIKLYRMQQSHGILTSNAELKKVERCINKIYENISVTVPIDKQGEETKYKNVVPRVVLIHYGVDNKQLRDNYGIMSGIWDSLALEDAIQGKSVDYEVAYDITHSFRSLPLYNLIIFNYHSHISNVNIVIKHIFYGMLDLKREVVGYLEENCGDDVDKNSFFNSGLSYAPLVDLKNLVDVLELTEGVSEFKNTGSTGTLSINLKKNGYHKLNKALNEFDFAMQLNDFSKVEESLQNLKKELGDSGKDIRRHTDLKQMMYLVLKSDFPSIFENSQKVDFSLVNRENSMKSLAELSALNVNRKSEYETCKEKADFQFLLVKWNQKHHRYGITIATALETLRSYFVILSFGEQITVQDFNDEEKRKEAEKIFLKLFSKNIKNMNVSPEYRSSLERIYLNYNNIKQIRNTFAHNLMDEGKKDIFDSMHDIMSKIENFITDIGVFVGKFESYRNEMFQMFQINFISDPPFTAGNNQIRIIVSRTFDEKELKNKTLFKSNKYNYTVFRLDQRVVDFIFQDEFDIAKSSVLLSHYFSGLSRKSFFKNFSGSIGVVLDDKSTENSFTPQDMEVLSAVLHNNDSIELKPTSLSTLQICKKVFTDIEFQINDSDLNQIIDFDLIKL